MRDELLRLQLAITDFIRFTNNYEINESGSEAINFTVDLKMLRLKIENTIEYHTKKKP